MEQFNDMIRASSNRVTRPRQQIFTVLQDAVRPLSLSEIVKETPAIDRASVYRTLELFEQLHIIDVIYVGWKKRYELADPFRPHHHHLQCTVCRQTIAIDTPELEHNITAIAGQHGYQLTRHHIELWGICPNCVIKEGRKHGEHTR